MLTKIDTPLLLTEWFRGTSPNHGLRPLKAHNQTVTQAGNVTISWLHYLPKPSHHHQTLICRGSNDELMSANSQTVEDYHRLEIFCKFFCAFCRMVVIEGDS